MSIQVSFCGRKKTAILGRVVVVQVPVGLPVAAAAAAVPAAAQRGGGGGGGEAGGEDARLLAAYPRREGGQLRED